ncbi:MAG: peptide chain release factor N(5)-glutamine methyltransferase [Methylophilaceae bacterium]
MTTSIRSILKHASAMLANGPNASTHDAMREAQLLLQHVLNVNRAWLIAHENDALAPNIHPAFETLIKRRLNSEPIAYILGVREFYGLKLKVTADTLIPRPDTETLVETALAKITSINMYRPSFRRKSESSDFNLLDSDSRRNDSIKMLDLGTGSGAIALAIAKHAPQAFVTATDASENALKVAIENAQNLEIANVKFVLSDWFSALQNQSFDVIVSNPPYIETSDAHLNQDDLRFEPISALASGQDGLDDIRKIICQAPQHLTPHGWLMLEHGYHQAMRVSALMKKAGFSEIETIKDLGGNQRVTLGCWV